MASLPFRDRLAWRASPVSRSHGLLDSNVYLLYLLFPVRDAKRVLMLRPHGYWERAGRHMYGDPFREQRHGG